MRVLGLVRDLFFRSKLDAVAAALGRVEISYASTVDAARAKCSEIHPQLVFADLSDESFSPADVVAVAASAPAAKLVGFASHVDLKSMKLAREAGFAHVLSRQEFAAQLPKLLAEVPD